MQPSAARSAIALAGDFSLAIARVAGPFKHAAPAGSGVASEVLASEIVRVVQKRTSGASSGDLAGQLYDGLLQGPLPFELRVLDAVLREDLLRKQA